MWCVHRHRLCRTSAKYGPAKWPFENVRFRPKADIVQFGCERSARAWSVGTISSTKRHAALCNRTTLTRALPFMCDPKLGRPSEPSQRFPLQRAMWEQQLLRWPLSSTLSRGLLGVPWVRVRLRKSASATLVEMLPRQLRRGSSRPCQSILNCTSGIFGLCFLESRSLTRHRDVSSSCRRANHLCPPLRCRQSSLQS
jgi:hypothetical protein